MSFVEAESLVEAVQSSQKNQSKKVATHPKVSIMVDEAIKTLADRKGSSLHAIKKFINSNYNADAQKLSIYIKKYLKAAVERGDLIQPTGRGATGSFKINKQKIEAKPKDSKSKLLTPGKMQVPTFKKNTIPTKSQTRFKLYVSTPKRSLKPKKKLVRSPDVSPVEKKEDKNTQVDSDTDNSFIIIPEAKRAKKPKVSLPTKPRRSLDPVPKKVKAKELLSRQSSQDTGSSPAKLEKKDATKSIKAKKSHNPGKSERAVTRNASKDQK